MAEGDQGPLDYDWGEVEVFSISCYSEPAGSDNFRCMLDGDGEEKLRTHIDRLFISGTNTRERENQAPLISSSADSPVANVSPSGEYTLSVLGPIGVRCKEEWTRQEREGIKLRCWFYDAENP